MIINQENDVLEKSNTKIVHWISALRLRTLPLVASSVMMGSVLAWKDTHSWSWTICLLTFFVSLLLQILSNLANDYGDSKHGADNENRKGPSRQVQAGNISSEDMKFAIVVCGLIAFVSGLYLLYVSALWSYELYAFVGLGVMSIIVALKYTLGDKPYGYVGLGDFYVMVFFGYVGVVGTYYLQVKSLDDLSILLPATTAGALAVLVLNLNNIRDIESDKLAGKRSIPVRIGYRAATFYHIALTILASVCIVFYLVLEAWNYKQYACLLILPRWWQLALIVYTSKQKNISLDPYLKHTALSSFAFTTMFTIVILLF